MMLTTGVRCVAVHTAHDAGGDDVVIWGGQPSPYFTGNLPPHYHQSIYLRQITRLLINFIYTNLSFPFLRSNLPFPYLSITYRTPPVYDEVEHIEEQSIVPLMMSLVHMMSWSVVIHLAPWNCMIVSKCQTPIFVR
jgi:hypothetical protein